VSEKYATTEAFITEGEAMLESSQEAFFASDTSVFVVG
jgi:predicted ATP-grasp superfamily ATP-dependent carboligase